MRFIPRAIKDFLKKTPPSRQFIEHLRREGKYPSGHYYSPIPSKHDIESHLVTHKTPPETLPGIDLNESDQYRLLKEYSQLYAETKFAEDQVPSQRYYYRNNWFCFSDAYFLYHHLRDKQPKRIIEVGSGFSSALMLDTIEKVYAKGPELTFIEPNPFRLGRLLTDADREYAGVIVKRVQEVPLEVFDSLESGDLLFIDSSHVVKYGSDVQLLLFEVLPRIKPGVTVHFHDVFHSFEYHAVWLREGRYWNESYVLRAFLTNNAEWQITCFVSYLNHKYSDLMRETMPLCAKYPGGSLYLQRR